MGVCKYGISPLVFNLISHYRASANGLSPLCNLPSWIYRQEIRLPLPNWLNGRKLPKKLTINVFCVMFRLTFIILGDTNEMERTTLRNVSRLL